MAITKVGTINTIPTVTDDWTNTVKHINAFINQVNNQAFILSDPLGTTSPVIKQGCYINHGGTLYIVDTEDYTPSGSPADGNVYIKLTPSGDTLVGSFITDISSYSFNQQYGNMVSGDDMILPYLLVKSGTSWTKYRNDVISPQYKMNQNLRTTDSPTFTQITTTNGPNKPVDNNDSTPPSIGIGGYTFTDYTNDMYLPSGGIYIAIWMVDTGPYTYVYRYSGGTKIAGAGHCLILRIA